MPKIIEFLKEKKLNQKKVQGVISEIQKYSSIVSTEKPSFDSEKEQKDQVLSLVQSAMDLLERRAKLRMSIDITNIKTKIRIPKGIIMKEHEISMVEALSFKVNYSEYIKIFSALNKNTADTRLRSFSGSTNQDGSKVTSIQMYDENFKNNWIKDLQVKLDFIDAHLEMLNATTEICETF